MKKNELRNQTVRSNTTLLQKGQWVLLAAWIFAIPTNLFWKILPNFGFVGGLQIDYLIPKLYLSELVGIALIGSWVLKKMRAEFSSRFQLKSFFAQKFFLNLAKLKLQWKLAVVTVLLLLARQLLTSLPIAATWFLGSTLLHLAIGLAAFEVLKQFPQNRRIITARITAAVLFTAVFQAVVGLYQFWFQRQILGFLFFGEPSITRALSLNRMDLSWLDSLIGTHLGYRIAAYGTTPHPNVLAGFLAVSLSWAMYWWVRNRKKLSAVEHSCVAVTALLIFCALVVTGSVTGWLTCGSALLVLFLRKKLSVLLQKIFIILKSQVWLMIVCFGVGTVVLSVGTLSALRLAGVDSESLTRREYLSSAAVELFRQSPLFGVGMNQFTAELETVLTVQEEVRFVQPAHQLFLLLLAENGVLGSFLLILLIANVLHERRLLRDAGLSAVILLFVLCFDHYLYTLATGQQLFLLVMTLLVLE